MLRGATPKLAQARRAVERAQARHHQIVGPVRVALRFRFAPGLVAARAPQPRPLAAVVRAQDRLGSGARRVPCTLRRVADFRPREPLQSRDKGLERARRAVEASELVRMNGPRQLPVRLLERRHVRRIQRFRRTEREDGLVVAAFRKVEDFTRKVDRTRLRVPRLAAARRALLLPQRLDEQLDDLLRRPHHTHALLRRQLLQLGGLERERGPDVVQAVESELLGFAGRIELQPPNERAFIPAAGDAGGLAQTLQLRRAEQLPVVGRRRRRRLALLGRSGTAAARGRGAARGRVSARGRADLGGLCVVLLLR
mmetsp:Transcript_5068/g.18047  ORF Transcript_5068/g.18047 Transcript_5068/m.18047 type:complete len:311 (+) Transcript_5068:714-1646(+)